MIMFSRIALVLALLSPSIAFADDVTDFAALPRASHVTEALRMGSNAIFIDPAPGTHEVTVRAADGNYYTVHSAVELAVDREPILLAQADTGSGSAELVPSDAGSGSAAAAAATQDAPKPPPTSDIGLATKLWKSGSFLGLGIIVLYVALFAGWKLDKKHAFYWATGLGTVGLLAESVRRGDTPSVTMIMSTTLPSVGIMLQGPGHTKEPSKASPAS
jgi:hypothetical protein